MQITISDGMINIKPNRKEVVTLQIPPHPLFILPSMVLVSSSPFSFVLWHFLVHLNLNYYN